LADDRLATFDPRGWIRRVRDSKLKELSWHPYLIREAERRSIDFLEAASLTDSLRVRCRLHALVRAPQGDRISYLDPVVDRLLHEL